MPPGSVAIPRDCALGARPEIEPYDSGAVNSWPAGTKLGSTLKRVVRWISSAVPLMPSGPGRRRLSRLVCSMANRSTCGVNGTLGGKWPLMPMGATKPGPRTVGSGLLGFDSISRWVMVV
jgi:hypothetical protein